MKKFGETVLDFIEENLKNPQKIVFLGSAGQSHSGVYAYDGAFFLEKDLNFFKENKIVLPEEKKLFHELYGKYSCIEGAPEKLAFKNLTEAYLWYTQNAVFNIDSYEGAMLDALYKTEKENQDLKTVLANKGLLSLEKLKEIDYALLPFASPFLLTENRFIDGEWKDSVFGVLDKKFELVTTLKPKGDKNYE